jgi:group II intron reverse transcriptase/maturase
MENTATKINRINAKALREPKVRFSYVKHLLNEEYLLQCFKELERFKAAGVDGRTTESYTEMEIKQDIHKLVESMKKDAYTPQPVRRVEIPKENGEKRALGIPTVLDKIVQSACGKIISAIWEPKLLNVSFGYRPAKDAHGALKEIFQMISRKPVTCILEADIQGFFDHVNHDWMRRMLSEHIIDPRFLNLITSMLKSGIMDHGKITETTEGTPQGGIISPILANIYLHYILDLWLELREKKQMRGYVQLIRYADDFVIGCQYRDDAERLMRDIKTRFAMFGLSLAMEKTKIIEYGRFAQENRKRRGQKKPETFDFLGFTHYCGKTRKGKFTAKVKTSKKRMNRALKSMHDYFQQNRSKPLKQLWEMAAVKVRGHFQYYGVSWNYESIDKFRDKTEQLAFMWVNRRSQKRSFTWEHFKSFLDRYPLPKARIYYAFYNTS